MDEYGFFRSARRGHSTHIDTMPVIRDLKQLETAVLDQDFQRCRTGINGILNQLFQGMHGGHDDLPSRDFVHHIWIKSLFMLLGIQKANIRKRTDFDSLRLLRRLGAVFCCSLEAARLGVHVHFVHASRYLCP